MVDSSTNEPLPKEYFELKVGTYHRKKGEKSNSS